MDTAIDHVFICTAIGAPAAERLRTFGLVEGSPNVHGGQGTACRRFFFRNAMLELLWVENAAQACGDPTRRTKLWERWSNAGGAASPFGIILGPAPGGHNACPFRSWEYRPPAMPDLTLDIAEDAGIEEPMWCYMKAGRPPAGWPPERRQPLEHPAGVREVTGVRIVSPLLPETSVTLAMAKAGVIGYGAGPEYRLELQFDGGDANRTTFQPDLPLAFRW
jgi:hypothetical protein